MSLGDVAGNHIAEVVRKVVREDYGLDPKGVLGPQDCVRVRSEAERRIKHLVEVVVGMKHSTLCECHKCHKEPTCPR